jgi:Tfp pilus assembly pilus retraction ATPase PilT
MYPILGYMGVLLLIILFVAWIQKRKDIIIEKFFRRKMLRISLKKQHPDIHVTEKEKELFRNLSEVSPAETDALKNDIHETAKKIIENTDDIEKYLDEHLSVDDKKIQKNVNEMMDSEN